MCYCGRKDSKRSGAIPAFCLPKIRGGATSKFAGQETKNRDSPKEIFTLGLCPGELAVYAYLIFCEDRETYQCWPSIGRICQHTGMSANTVAKYIRQLEEKRLIDTEPTKVKTKAGLVRNGNLFFTIRPVQEAVDHKLEQEFSALPEPKRSQKKH